MSENKLSKFLTLYKTISAFGPSRMQPTILTDKYLISFSDKDFFEKLYIPTNLEQDLYREVNNLNNGNIIALCGPSGSGKSTVSLKVKSDVENQLRTKLLFLDLRIEESSKTFDNIDVIDDEHIRTLLLNQFEKDFPVSINKEEISSRLSLYYFLLSPETEIVKLRNAQIFLPLQKLSNKVARLFNKITLSGSLDFKEWFFNNSNQIELTEIFSDLDDLIDISHYVAFLRNEDKYDKIIFWLDNIDAFSNIQQTQIIDILEKLQRNILNSTKVVISVREENIYRVGKFTDNFNEPYISQITFKDPDSNNDVFTNYGAINVPVMSFENIEKMIARKLEFAFDRFIKYGEKLKIQLHRHDTDFEKLKTSNVYKYNTTRDSNIRQRNQFVKDIEEHNSSLISIQEFNELKKISTKIVDCFEKEKVIFLANNSLKNYLKIHGEFLNYLINLQLENKESLNSEELTHSYITTIFLSWIHSVNEYFGIETFNIIEELGRIQNSVSEIRIGCFLPYLILTRIWNDCIHLNGKPSPDNSPRVYNIVSDLCTDFFYSENQVKQTLYELYRQVGGKGNFISFRTKKNIDGPEDLDLKTTVRITYRGRVTLGYITNSYGYIKECTERLKNVNEPDVEIEELTLLKIAQITTVHLNSLLTIKNIVYKNHTNWYTNYLRKYGIPLEPEFVRNSRVGTLINNTKFNRCLYLESVFDSLNSYFHIPNQYKNSLIALSSQFYNYLENLVKNEEVSSIEINYK